MNYDGMHRDTIYRFSSLSDDPHSYFQTVSLFLSTLLLTQFVIKLRLDRKSAESRAQL